MGYVERRIGRGVDLWTSGGRSGEQRILPDGCLDLLWLDGRLVVAGPDPVARVHVGSGAPVSGVRLHGGRGPALLGVPASALTGRTVPLADLWGDRRTQLVSQQVADDPADALARWVAGLAVDPFGDRLLALLGAGTDVAAAARRLGWSNRQLQRRTHQAFGYGPQHLARVLRLQRAIALADAGRAWAEAAAAAGYTDQAHLSRDVRALGGVTPTRLRAQRVRSVQDVA